MTFAAPWGKSDREFGVRHHLAHHCADVAATFLVMTHLPAIRSRMEKAAGRALTRVEIDRLGVLVFLHDIGKLFPSFQAKAWPSGSWNGELSGHVLEAIDVLVRLDERSVAAALHVHRVQQWQNETGLFDAVLAHHGRPAVDAGDRRAQMRARWRTVGKYDPTQSAIEIGQVMSSWFATAFSETDRQLPSTAEFEHLFAGLTAFADWIGSSRPIASYATELNCTF